MDFGNELEYMFGGAKDAREGNLQKGATGKYEPNFIQKYIFGTTSDDLKRNVQQGQLDRFDDTRLGQDAQRFGVEVTRADMGNLGGVRDRIDSAESLKNTKSELKATGYTGDLSGYTDASQLAPLIRKQELNNTLETQGAIQSAQFNSPGAVRERDVQDKRWNETQRLNLMDRADAREAKASELEYMMMRDRKEDRRYNESIDRQDRKDRQASIQTLVAGLAQLGAAFAI